MSEAPVQSPPRKKRSLFLILTLLGVLGVALWLLPRGLEHLARDWIAENGGGRMSVTEVRLNPFTAELKLKELTIDLDQQRKLALADLRLEMEWLPLLRREIRVSGLSLRDVEIELDRGQDLLRVGGVEIPLVADGSASGTAWSFEMIDLELENSSLNYKDARQQHQLDIEQLKLSNLSTRNASTGALLFRGKLNGSPIAIQSDRLPLMLPAKAQGRISAEQLDLAPFAPLLPQQLGKLAGRLSLDNQVTLEWQENRSLQLSLDGSGALTRLSVNAPGLQIEQKRIAWKGKQAALLNDPELALAITGELAIDDGALNLQGEEGDTAFDLGGARWAGEIQLNQATAAGTLTATGTLHLESSNLRLAEATGSLGDLTLRPKAASFSWDEAGVSLKLPGGGTAQGIHFDDLDNAVSQQSLTWEAAIGYQQQSGRHLLFDGTLQSSPLSLTRKSSQATLRSALIDGEFRLDLELETATATLDGKFSADQLSLGKEGDAGQLVQLERLEARQITSDAAQTTIDQLGALGLSLGVPGDLAPLLAVEQLKLAKLRLHKEQGLSVTSATPHNLRYLLQRNKSGEWNISQFNKQLAGLFAAPTTSDTGKTDTPLLIENLTLEGDSQLQLVDESTQPRFKLSLVPTFMQIKQLGTGRAADLELAGKINNEASLNLSGKISPLDQPMAMELSGEVVGLAMPPLSAYTKEMLGYQLDSGKMNAEIRVTADKGLLDGETKLTLNQVEVTAVNPPAQATPAKTNQGKQEAGIPLESALGMLRDKNNTIRISIPIGGDLNNPTFDPSDAINQAIATALKRGARTYLATALFPFGTLLTLVELAGDSAAKVRLDPIDFAAGNDALSETHHAYLDKVAKVLEERPELHVRLCGVAVAEDRELLSEKGKKAVDDEQLLELARNRARSVADYLSDQQKVPADRLITCRAEIHSEEKTAPPRVDLLI